MTWIHGSKPHYSELSHISQRIVGKGSKISHVSSLTKASLQQLEANVELWSNSNDENKHEIQNSPSNTHNISSLAEEAPLRDPKRDNVEVNLLGGGRVR